MDERFIYRIDGIDYTVIVKRKRIKNTYLRHNADLTVFTLTMPYLRSIDGVKTFVRRSILHFVNKKRKVLEPPYGSDYTYILGNKTNLVFENEDELERYLRIKFLPFVTERVRFYESKMGIDKPYNVRVRKTKSSFGTNSRKTHTVAFCTSLYHFDVATIDSVVVHELAHHFEFNHSKKFYNVVLKYCPDYWKFRKKLLNKIYGSNN